LSQFKKYFIQDPTLKEYLINNSVTSTYANVDKSFPTIDFDKYLTLNPDLAILGPMPNVVEHFYTYGQFERRRVPFITLPDKLSSISGCVATIITSSGAATGFLFNGGGEFDVVDGKTKLWIVTCYHLFENTLNKNVMRAVINYNESNMLYGESKSLTLEFKIVGYDIFTDICVGMYDENLDYNKVFNSNINLNVIPKLKIFNQEKLQTGDTICTIGNISYEDNLSYLEGSVIDPNYVGTFNDSFFMGAPGSILAEIHSSKGMSGSPIFIKRNGPNGDEYRCVGMVNTGMGQENQYMLGIGAFTMNLVVNNTISRWFVYGPLYKSNIKLMNFFIKDGYPKRWLGIRSSYLHHKITKSKYKAFFYL
jgi:hypothetical protein